MVRFLACSIILLSLFFSGCSTRKPPVAEAPQTAEAFGAFVPRRPNYEVALVVNLGDYDDSESAVWLHYLMARDAWITQHLPAVQPEDFQHYTPRFPEELAGRAALAQAWGNLRQRGAPSDNYLDSLTLIVNEGYLEPYVWRYHHQEAWGPAPSDLPWVRFDQWMAQRLPGFQPETVGRIRLLPPGATAREIEVSELKN